MARHSFLAAEDANGYYAYDAGGNEIARYGLTSEELERQTANLIVSGYHVVELTEAQQIALLLRDIDRVTALFREVST